MTRRRRISLWLLAAALALAVGTFLACPRLAISPERTPEEQTPAPAGAREGTRPTIGAWYELYFTEPQLTERPSRRGGLDEMLAGLMGRSRQTLDVAIYDLDLGNVAEAMAGAAGRGVRVRLVTDTDTLADTRNPAQVAAFVRLRHAGIPIVDDGRRNLMHHKFTVVDGEWVQTGSWNYTERETFRNNNNAIVVQSRALAENYTAEFEKMFTSRLFGAAKPPDVPRPSLSIAGARVENYFSPGSRGAAHVIRWLGSARSRVHFLAFSFTHDGIGDALLERARAGVEVAGVFETAGADTQFSEFRRLKESGLGVLLDGNPSTMHHKVMVIDDRVSIFGSFNFSASADRENDENLLIVEDPGLATAFEAEFQRVRAVAILGTSR